MRAFARSRTPLAAPAVGPVPADHHNRALAAAQRKADDLEERLVPLLVAVLEQAADVAARNFETRATRHLNAGALTQDFSADLTAAGDVDRRSTMIAVKPRPEQAAALAEDGGAGPETMHVTLAYLGKTDGPLETVRDALAGIPGEHAPLAGSVGGVGCFADNGRGHPAILLPSVPGLLELRHHVTEALTSAGLDYGRDYGFVPHLTVAYRPDGPEPPDIQSAGAPLSFDDLWIVRGDVETVQLPLVGAKPVTAAADLRNHWSHWPYWNDEPDPDWLAGERAYWQTMSALEAAGEQDPDDEDSHDRLMGVAAGAPAAYGFQAFLEEHGAALIPIYDPVGRPGVLGELVEDGTIAEIRAVAKEHAPDDGYGDTWWNADEATVYWVPADWTTNEEIEEAREAFLDVGGVEQVEVCDECGAPEGDGWTRAYRSARHALTAAGDGFCLPASVRGVTDPVRQAAVESVMKSSLEHVGVAFDPVNPLAARVLSQSASQIQGIAETTQLDVMKTISAAHEAGLSIPDTAKSIRAVMAEAAPARARLIARTELAGAVHGGSLAATQIVAQVTGSSYTKTWRTAPGANYPRHEDYDGLDGQTVGLDEMFDVGGSDLEFPGDPSGPPDEVCNCRCSMTYTDEGGGGEVEASALEASAARARVRAPGGLMLADPCPAHAGVESYAAEELADLMEALTAAGPSAAGWTSPAPEEVLPIHCEVPAAARGIDEAASRVAEPVPAGPLPGPPVGDTISVGPAPFLPQTALDTIQRLGLDGWPPTKGPDAERILGAARDTTNLYAPNGIWPNDRALLQRGIVDRALEGKIAADDPTAYFTAGGGASGKSSLTFRVGGQDVTSDELGQRTDTVLVDPDAIKRMLPEFEQLYAANDPYAAFAVHDESSMIARQIVAEAQARGISVVLDTTGSSTEFVDKIAAARDLGYQTQVAMMSIPTNEAIMRSLTRALRVGPSQGRFVPIQSLKYAHAGASRNAEVWMHDPNVGSWRIFENSGGAPRLVASGADGRETVRDQRALDQILAKGGEGAPTSATAELRAADVGPTIELAPIPDLGDDYVRSLQVELRKLGKQIAANRYTLKGELDQAKRDTLDAQIKAWETRRDDVRALIETPDPKLESARLSKQIAAARFEIKNGRGNVRLEARLKVLERRRDDLRKVMGGPLKETIVARETKVKETARTAPPASRTRRTYRPGDDVDLTGVSPYISARPGWINTILPGVGPDNYLVMPATAVPESMGSYMMGPSVVFADAGSGSLIRVEMGENDIDRPAYYARLGEERMRNAFDGYPEQMNAGQLQMITFANGDCPTNATYAAAYNRPGFRAAATAGGGHITYWEGRTTTSYGGQETFDHEMGHIVGFAGGPPAPVRWTEAQAADVAHDRDAFPAGALGRQWDAGSGREFALGNASVTSYGGVNDNEDWAESIRLWMTDRRRGYIGAITTGGSRRVTFAEAYPNRDRLIREGLGIPPG